MKEFDMDNVTYSKIEDQRQKMLRQDRLYYYINLDKNCKLKRRKQVFTAKRLMHIGNARSEKDSIILDKNGTQFGPYIFVPKGNYNVRITGENLDKLHFSCTSEMGKKKHSLENMKCCGTAVEYYVKFRRNASNVEFVSRNLQTEPSKIYNITLTEL